MPWSHLGKQTAFKQVPLVSNTLVPASLSLESQTAFKQVPHASSTLVPVSLQTIKERCRPVWTSPLVAARVEVETTSQTPVSDKGAQKEENVLPSLLDLGAGADSLFQDCRPSPKRMRTEDEDRRRGK